MINHEDYYDFRCGSDTKIIKFAAVNDEYYSIMLQADAAKTIDFSGGTRQIETIKFQKCFKMSRIIWPDDTSAIRSLSIYGADNLAILDLTPLHNLEKLSILDCPELTTIRGIPPTLSILNIHRTKIKELDLHKATNIKTINIITHNNKFKINADHRNYLQHLWVTMDSKVNSVLHLNVSNCPILRDIYLDAQKTVVKLDIRHNHALREITVHSNNKSSIAGINDCKKLQYIDLTLETLQLKNIDKDTLVNRIKNNSADKIYNPTEIAEKFKTGQQEFYQDCKEQVRHHSDRETIIQNIASRQEMEHGLGAAISLLSHDLRHIVEISEHDLRKIRKKVFTEPRQFQQLPTLKIFYLLGTEMMPHPGKLIKNAKTTANTPHLLVSALSPKNAKDKNITVITDNDIENNPEVLRHLISLKKFQKIEYRGITYRYENQPIFYSGNRTILESAIPGIANSIYPVDLLPNWNAEEMSQEEVLLNEFAYEASHVFQSSQHQAVKEFETAFKAVIEEQKPKSLPPEQVGIDANSHNRPEPDFQDPIDAQANKPRHHPEVTDQIPVDGTSKNKKLSPDLPQYGIDAAANRDRPSPIDQYRIDAHKQLPPDMPQEMVDAAANQQNKFPDIPEQVAIHANKKSLPDMPQHGIDAAAEYHHQPRPHITDQFGIYANKRLPPDPEQQININADAASPQPLADIPEQVLIHAETSKADVPQLIVDEPLPQSLINIHKKLSETPEPSLAQHLLQANKSAQEPLQQAPQLSPDVDTPQLFLSAARLRREDLPEQYLINHETQHKSAAEMRLLNAAKKLANAMQDMLAEATQQDKLSQAKAMIKCSVQELSHANKIRKEDVLDSARTLIEAIHITAQVLQTAPRASAEVKPEVKPTQNND